MLIRVEHVYGQLISKLVDGGWKLYAPPPEDLMFDLTSHRRISGCQLQKDFQGMGDAIREFEALTGEDVYEATHQDGVPCYDFVCEELELYVSGWNALKYIYPKWAKTPRLALEAWND